ncbi:MAG: ABC transporter substrate-binding protein [Rhodospirillales bacterium]|nr:ABC transporter substrate-binding protein [Rhodospirillales bacterium]
MLTRRHLLAATAATPLATIGFAGAAEAKTPRGVAVMAKQIDDIISFDPAEAYEFSNNEVDANVYRRLVAPDPHDNTKIAGDLAKSWTVSPDGTTFTFQLKTNARFPSGKAVTAEDAAYSLQRVVKLNKTPGFIITQFGFTKDNVDSLIHATGPHTLVLKLPAPQATSFVLFCLTANVGSIVEKATAVKHEAAGDMGNGWLKTNTAGAGPYQMVSWAASDHINMTPNPHSGIHVNTPRIVIRHVKDPSAQLLLLQKGDADIVRDLTPDQIKTVAADKNFHITQSPQGSSMYIAMNQTMPELAKPQVIQAIKWAIDYDAIAKNITPNSWVVSQSFLPKGLPGALTTEPFHKDVAKAKALMAEAGLKDGFACTMDYISAAPYGDIAQAVQADLAAIGIKVTLVAGEQKQVITKTRARTHQLAMLVWGTDYFDPNSNAQAFCANPDDSDNSKLKILAWRSHFVDKELTDMVTQATAELDAAKRVAIYTKMQQLSQERAPFAMLLQKISSAELGKGVSGFVIGPLPDYTKYAEIKKA